MKKLTTIILSIIMVAAIGQAAFAKSSISVGMGIPGTNPYYTEPQNVYPAEISGSIELSDKMSLDGDLSMLISKDYSLLGAGFDFKYDLFSSNLLRVGTLFNANAFFGIYPKSAPIKSGFNNLTTNIGLFSEISVTPKLTLYSDFYFSVLSYTKASGVSLAKLYESGSGDFGFRYKLNDKMFAGAEFLYDMNNLSFGKVFAGYSF